MIENMESIAVATADELLAKLRHSGPAVGEIPHQATMVEMRDLMILIDRHLARMWAEKTPPPYVVARPLPEGRLRPSMILRFIAVLPSSQ